MPLSRSVSSSAIPCSLAATRYAGCSVADASASTVTGVSTTSSSASSTAAEFGVLELGAVGDVDAQVEIGAVQVDRRAFRQS